MKMFLFLLPLLLAVGGCENQSVDENEGGTASKSKVAGYVPPEGALKDVPGEANLRGGLYYRKGDEVPYSGILYALYENGSGRYQSTVKDGKLDGVSVEWYDNGNKQQETNYEEGILNGPVLTWHKDGQKASEGGYNDGKPDGRFEGWHENGQKSGEGNFKDGKSSDRKFWNSKGEPVDTFEASKK